MILTDSLLVLETEIERRKKIWPVSDMDMAKLWRQNGQELHCNYSWKSLQRFAELTGAIFMQPADRNVNY